MRKIIIHIAVWLVLAYSLFFSLTIFLPVDFAIYRSVSSISLMAASFYFAGWILTNQFLIKKRNLILFITLGLISIFSLSILRVKLLDYFAGDAAFFSGPVRSNRFFDPDNITLRKNILRYSRLGAGRIPYLTGFLIYSVLSVIGVLFRLYENKDRKERESREELQRSQEAQILYLKSQVNPHFLFNTLNNLYGLTYSKSELAPQMVLGLSDTMRYLIYETEQKLVPVEKELNFIQNYIDLEKMRISTPENIRVSVQVNRPFVFIPPLLLLPFIENCFKHGRIGKEEDGWIELDTWDEKGQFLFVCKNNFTENKIEKLPGIGLSNVKKRLKLIYGDRFELQTVKQNDEFMVSVQFPVFERKDML
ncbi:sensor histidine kinase [Maribellus maritimus]|uniref:sensor histidine kinase n=1 Tax=Maribellus maritimus TaxID=2870838 RepID=UPI001EEACEBB|nr:histidine kinase [Maribellus maritimus]MCG6189827.1 histidine kinase [Maribellus maritimus]